ncbi:FlxA-like family protein [Aneurinibacillus uraniidurans]|uniref:FlxA-like family protein n=1 Tax=Aneurinibacillus uraniidurans TaxID=2966586 RepID=UPI00234A6572|nr:FlxA-like family protein [Aneurinibacillus sp. B1]WCN39628.1 FlxA-like family protein [Aneurinibacillus sp. B1]
MEASIIFFMFFLPILGLTIVKRLRRWLKSSGGLKKFSDGGLNGQIAQLNEQLKELRNNLSSTTDEKQREELQKQIEKVKSQIDSLSSTQQMDMLRLQSMSNKRNEAFDVMTNFIKKMQDSRSSIIGNMR